MGVSRTQSTPNFLKSEHLLPPDTHMYVCVSRGKKCSFFGKLGVFCFLETAVLRFALLPHYQQTNVFIYIYKHFPIGVEFFKLEIKSTKTI